MALRPAVRQASKMLGMPTSLRQRQFAMLRARGEVTPVLVLNDAMVILLVAAAASFGAADEAADGAVLLAREAIERQLQVSAHRVDVVEAVAINWPDSSLGCPRLGLRYQPVVVPGHRVVLKLGDHRYVVHVGAGRAVLCGTGSGVRDGERPRSAGATLQRGTASEAAVGLKLAEQARADLAARLGLSRERVTIALYRPTSWPDGGLGCLHPGDVHPPQSTPGFRIQLQAGGRTYEFHSDRSRVLECPPDLTRRDVR
jgi:hypothetical protein